MVDIYFYIPKNKLEYIVDCGLKLSDWFDREIPLNGEMRKCISMLLNPRDDIEKYKSEDYECLKIEVEPQYCYIADRFLYEASEISRNARELYIKTIIPVESYIFGMYRLPECLVLGTLISNQIGVVDKRLDSPVLFESSEKLYTSNMLEIYREENENFNDALLYYFFNKLAEIKKVDKIEDKDKKIAVFFDRACDKTFCIRIPDENKYRV